MAVVYRHIRLDKNEPFYIGIGNNIKRAYKKEKRNDIWYNIINKTQYEIEIMFDDLTWEEACAKEIEFIKLYGKIKEGGILANITNGGEGQLGMTISEENRIKARELMLINLQDEEFVRKRNEAASINGKNQAKNVENRKKLMDATNK